MPDTEKIANAVPSASRWICPGGQWDYISRYLRVLK